MELRASNDNHAALPHRLFAIAGMTAILAVATAVTLLFV